MKTNYQENSRLQVFDAKDLNESRPPGDADSRLRRIKENWNGGERLMRRLVAKRMQTILFSKLKTV